jgi:hypothetical protein
MMKRIIGLFGLLLLCSHFTMAQQIIDAEYFWDTDPGQGNATAISALDGNLDEAIEELFSSAVIIPAVGIHTFNIRIKGQDNTWSNVFSYAINVRNQSLQSRTMEVLQAEYFWDTDPGQGSATPILAFDGNLDEAIEELFSSAISTPSTGLHTFNIRIRGEDNTWSDPFSYVINVRNQALISRDVKVTQAEYFWDTDPGQGSATTILAFDGNLDEAIEALFSSAVNTPATGIHTFNIRVRGEDNTWSDIFSYVINVRNQGVVTRDVKVVQAEYFWDTDPGQGSATPILAFDGNLDEAIESLFTNPVATPSDGMHLFNIRVRGEDNTWSSVFQHAIHVIDSNSYSTVDTNICAGNTYTVPSGDETYSVAGIYYDTLVNATMHDSILTINLTVTNGTSSTINPTVCGSYLSPEGNTYTATGTYIDVIPNVTGCDSTITINLTVGNPNSSSITEVACDSYLSPAGNNYTVTGIYQDIIPNVSGCDSTITIDLTVNSSTVGSESVTACDLYVWPVTGFTYTITGAYNTTLSNAAGCDSTVTLNLTIHNSNGNAEVVTACDSYFWVADGNTYTSSGSYGGTLTNIYGCDSVVTLNLTITNSTTSSISPTACDSYLSPEGNTYTSTGTYIEVISNAAGCDSTITINLTVNSSSTGLENVTACDSYFWATDGNSYTSTGTYNTTLTNAIGCDSIVTLNLTINNSTTGSETVTTCDSYTWAADGNTYSSSGTYNTTLTTAAGCDSVVTLNLTINTVNVSVTQSASTLTASTAVASYQWVTCPSMAPIGGETNQSFTATSDGDYAVIVTENGCTDTSACITLTGVGITEKGFEDQLSVYPNPTQGAFTVDLGNTFYKITISITDMVGKLIHKENFYEKKLLSLSLEQPPGVYFMRIEVGTKQALIRLVKQ